MVVAVEITRRESVRECAERERFVTSATLKSHLARSLGAVEVDPHSAAARIRVASRRL